MSVAIVASSKGGNTKNVADALTEALKAKGVDVSYSGSVPVDGAPGAKEARDAVEAATTVFVGFWTDKGDCAPEVAELLSKLSGKRVFLFGTAGFGGSPEYFERILGNVRSHLADSSELVGSAMCQGKMGPAVRHRYEAMQAEHPDDARIQAMIDNFDAALSHPDADDLSSIVRAAENALGI